MSDSLRYKHLEELQEKIGIRWKNVKLLNQALTHSSYAKTEAQTVTLPDNERMEFLGDAVLELIIADYLFRKFSHLNEGGMSRIRSAVVSEESLAHHARKIDLGSYLLVGKDQDQICLQSATLADAYEALIGSLYLDQGLKKTKRFILNFFIKEEDLFTKAKDFKSLLQEYSQSVYKKLPRYKLIQEEGPDHQKMFKVTVVVNGETLGQGWGASKKKAEKIAARKAWERINTMEKRGQKRY